MRRYLVFARDFDSRASSLTEPGGHWEDDVKALHLQNRQRLIEALHVELGSAGFEVKLQNFRDAGLAPMSIVAHHNNFYRQIRYAFIHGLYYPSLVGGCSLGERILNHLLIELREDYKTTLRYKEVQRKESFDDWGRAIDILNEWSVFQTNKVAAEFKELGRLRHRSVHFDAATYSRLREDALSCLQHLAAIIQQQFGIAPEQAWRIKGTRGAFFIKAEAVNDPFICKYLIPQCPLVGPYYAVKIAANSVMFFDRDSYSDKLISDEEFLGLFETRTPDMLVPAELPLKSGVKMVGQLRWA